MELFAAVSKLLTLATPILPPSSVKILSVSVPLPGPPVVPVVFDIVKLSWSETSINGSSIEPGVSGDMSGEPNTFSTTIVLPTSTGVIALSTFSVVLGFLISINVGWLFSIS